jgi:hypothetical protein
MPSKGNGKSNLFTSIMFDTSGINALEDAGAGSDSIMGGLTSGGFEVILPAMVAEEVVATREQGRREALLRRLARLLNSAKCMWPAHEVLRLLISSHVNQPASFDWMKVNVRAQVYEDAISRRDFDDTLCAEQRHHHFILQKKFKKLWTGMRSGLDAILAKDPSKRPGCYQDAVAIAERDGGVLWGLGQEVYSVSKKRPTDAEIKSFIDICPPFRAVCYALVMAWYNGSLRRQGGTATAGRNDLMMAAYLPYCCRFITRDWPQKKELREIAKAARIECDVLSVSEFERGLVISV